MYYVCNQIFSEYLVNLVMCASITSCLGGHFDGAMFFGVLSGCSNL